MTNDFNIKPKNYKGINCHGYPAISLVMARYRIKIGYPQSAQQSCLKFHNLFSFNSSGDLNKDTPLRNRTRKRRGMCST